jgi:hypothetical protein
MGQTVFQADRVVLEPGVCVLSDLLRHSVARAKIAEALPLGPKLLVFLCRVGLVLDRLAKPALGDVVTVLYEVDETAHSVPVRPASRV